MLLWFDCFVVFGVSVVVVVVVMVVLTGLFLMVVLLLCTSRLFCLYGC